MSASDFSDRRWDADQFGRQPLSDVRYALKYLEKHEIAKHNVSSIAIAKFGTMAAGFMAGKKSKIKPEDFLPFDTRTIKKDTGVTDASMYVLRHLMKTKKMDGRVIALLAEELKGAGGRSQE